MKKINRDIKMDNYKGILIYLVVLGHLLFSHNYSNSSICLGIVKFIYSFHMPLFLIISGYFSKNIIRKKIYKLFILFVILNFSYVIYDYIVFDKFDLFLVKYSSWYLLALFIYRFIMSFPKINNFIINNKKLVLGISFFISVIFGIFNISAVVSKIVVYSFFFLFGVNLSDKYLNRSNKGNSLILFLLLMVVLFIVLMLPFSLDFYMGSSYVHWIQIIFRVLVFILDILLFFSIYYAIPNREITFFNKIGRNSLVIYVGHRIFTLIITYIFIHNKYFILIMLVSSILLCMMLGSDFVSNFINKILRKIKRGVRFGS